MVFAFITVACASGNSLDVASVNSNVIDETQEIYEQNENSIFDLEDVNYDSSEENDDLSNGLASDITEIEMQDTNDQGEDPISNFQFEPLSDLVWRVEPILEYESVIYCCGSFLNSNLEYIDTETGLPSGDVHFSHGAFDATSWVLDPVRNLFGHPSYGPFPPYNAIGMFPLDEFETRIRGLELADPDRFLRHSAGLLVVQRVDSTLRSSFNEWPDEWFSLTDEAFSGSFALMYNRALMTDFIFDGGLDGNLFQDSNWWSSNSFNTMHLSRDGNWGMVDRNGNSVLPFMFENFVRIDEETAFARLDGRYGILDLRATINNP